MLQVGMSCVHTGSPHVHSENCKFICIFARLFVSLQRAIKKTQEDMAITTARRRTTQQIIKAWNAVNGLDYSDKLELVTMIIESVKADKAADMTMEQMLEGYPYKRYTKDELNAMLDEAEANFEAGLGIPDEEAWDDLEEELALQEKEQHEMVETL